MSNPPMNAGGPHILGYDPPPVGLPPGVMEGATTAQKKKLRAIQIAYARKAAALHHEHFQQALDVFASPDAQPDAARRAGNGASGGGPADRSGFMPAGISVDP